MPKCPNCGHTFEHIVHPKVCSKQNAQTALAQKINTIIRESEGKRERRETWNKISEIINNMAVGEEIRVKNILLFFKTEPHSSGDIYRRFLDLKVCHGFLSKKFKPRGHIYTKINTQQNNCAYFEHKIKKIKNNEKIKYVCSFNFKEKGVVLKYTKKDFLDNDNGLS